MKDVYGVIYCIRNRINNKVYIGQTIKKGGFDERYNNDVFKNTHNNHLKKSILKYGIENFEIDKEFDVAYSQDELNRLEYMYIKIYNSTDSNYGYNKKDGGRGGHLSQETKQKIREANSGKNNHMFGKTHTKEARFKISKNHARISGENHSASKKVICLTTKEIFDSIRVASKFYKINNPSNIIENCKNMRKYSGFSSNGLPLIWMYYDDYKISTKSEIKRKIKNTFNTYIVCLNNNKIFKGQTEASNFYNVDGSSIAKCCRGKLVTAGADPITKERLRWAYLLDCEDLFEENILGKLYFYAS